MMLGKVVLLLSVTKRIRLKWHNERGLLSIAPNEMARALNLLASRARFLAHPKPT